MKVRCEEVFGPVVDDHAVPDLHRGARRGERLEVRAAGRRVHERHLNRAFEAHRTLEVGGVIVNDVSAFRADQMPYGGSKDSGFGREGLKWAMAEMTEPRIMVLSHVPL